MHMGLSTHMYVEACMHVEARGGRPALSFPTPSSVLPSTAAALRQTLSLNLEPHWQPPVSALPHFPPQCWGYRFTEVCPDFYVGDGDLNSGHQAFMASALPTEPSSQLFIFDKHLIRPLFLGPEGYFNTCVQCTVIRAISLVIQWGDCS